MASQPARITNASITNSGKDTVKFHDMKNWSGSVFGHYPPSISVFRSGNFMHKGVRPNDLLGSKGAIVYVGRNEQGGEENSAWLFAWSVLHDGSPNKVYAETGPASKYPKGSIDWDTIRVNLENATNECENSCDDTQTEISASIDQHGPTPSLAIVFNVIT